jgi:hypothetical protein
MKEMDDLIYQRMIADTGAGSLVALLGATARIGYGFQLGSDFNSPQLRFFQSVGTPGLLTGNFARTWQYFYQFAVWSSNYVDIISRLKRLFDGYEFTVSGTSEVGAASAVWDWDGPDSYDEGLEISRKDVRFRVFVIPKAQNPI